MAEMSGASTVVSEGNEGEKHNSIDDSGERKHKRLKCDEKDDQDFISELPDCLIQHILSFLPLTEYAIRTGILSKRWLNQWTYLPTLIFKSNGMSIDCFSDCIDNTLSFFNFWKINKFVIDSRDSHTGELRHKLIRWIRFATRRHVKELILKCETQEGDEDFIEDHDLPRLLFKNAFLVKLKTHGFIFRLREGEVNWASLKALHIGYADLPNQGIENVLYGSPVIEFLELCNCDGFEDLVIASKSLKTFRMIQCQDHTSAIEISCPNLEKLEMLGKLRFKSLKFKDLPSSVCATLNFENDICLHYLGNDKLKWVLEFLLQFQHVEELKLGPWFFMFLSLAALRGESTLLLNNKCLTVVDFCPEVAHLGLSISQLRFSLLEKLVLQLHPKERFDLDLMGSRSSTRMRKKYAELKDGVFDSLVSHLKTFEIVGLHYLWSNGGGERKDTFKFIRFLFTKARMLEKIVFVEAPGEGMIFVHKVCKKLSCIRKASPHVIVEVACLKRHDSDSDSDSDSNSDWDKVEC
ncbi:putative F-box protein At1g49610 [Euphorbia lathyris]|uniref:putative F-box protein At1g49610 n=1 Tax=Euphorbia lathyris TaxID=212925 RepID=UPI003313E05A